MSSIDGSSKISALRCVFATRTMAAARDTTLRTTANGLPVHVEYLNEKGYLEFDDTAASMQD